MARMLSRLIAVAGWTVLAALALAGVSLSAVAGLSATAPGRAALGGLVTRGAQGLVAGRLTVEGVELLPRGGVEARAVRLHDPDGRVVVDVARARVFADLTRLARRQVGVAVELTSPDVLLEPTPDGDLSIARAVAPARPAASPAPQGGGPERPAWTIGPSRVTVRGGALRWRRQDGSTAAEVTAIDVDAAGRLGAAGGSARLRLRAVAAAPVTGPLALEAVAELRGDRLEVPLLGVAAGASRVEAVGEGELRSRAFRAAITRLGVATDEVRRLVGTTIAPGGDVAGDGYAESDGGVVTAALDAAPPAGAGPVASGTAHVAVALRLAPAPPAVGFDVALTEFDPSRLVAQAPRGRLALAARGAAAGRALADARARLALELAPSRLRGVELGPIRLTARAAPGAIDVERLEARLPALAMSARGRWRERGAVSGDLAAESGDLARLGRDLAALTGVAVPPIGGRLRARATLAGTAAAPTVTARVDAPLLASGAMRAEAVMLSVEAAGPVKAARLRLGGRAARAEVGGTELHRVSLAASVAARDAAVSLSAAVPSVGPDPVALRCAARLRRDRRSAELLELSLRWPGARWSLARRAVVGLSPPAVDRLELRSGPASIALSGGLGPRDVLDVRLAATRVDLARLPPGLVPRRAGVAGELSVDARASGTTRAPSVEGRFELSGLALLGLDGLQASGDVRWNGGGRLAGKVGLSRTAGGALDVAAELRLPLAAARPGEPVALTVAASAWPLEALGRLAGLPAPVTGTVGGRLALSGTAAVPRLDATLALEGASVQDVGPISAELGLQGGGGPLQVKLATRLAGAPLLDGEVRVPIDLVALARRPEATLRAVVRAPISGTLELPGLELARVAGKAGLPKELAGTISGSAAVGGTLSAPRGRATLAVANGAWAGYRDVAAQVDVEAEAERTALTARASIGGAEALQADAALGAPVERLADPAARATAPLKIEATVPQLPLARAAGGALPVAGTLSARLSARGTVGRPEGRLDLGGQGIELEGRRLGDVAAIVRHEAPTTTAEISLRPASGGTLWAGATVDAPGGLGEARARQEAAATLRITSDGLDLGFLPALVPGVFRTASGRLTVDVSASGPLGRLRPRGSVKLEAGRFAIATMGEWSDVQLVASMGDGAIEVSRLEARRGSGGVSGRLAVRDLGTKVVRAEGRLELQRLTVTRDGAELATLDLPVDLAASLDDRRLDATVTLGAGTIRLPLKPSRGLQSVDRRADIVEVEEAERARRHAEVAPKPLEVRCRVVIPGKLFVRSDFPAVNLELKGDSTWRLAAGALAVDGSVEAVRGTVEPISGRVFHVERGRVLFTGGAPGAAQLDVVARYENPQAVVTVTIGESVAKPAIRLSSVPSMDDTEIAMLIATGRSDINLNTSGVDTVTAQDAGAAVVGAAMTAAFTGLVANKLPIDQLSVETSRVRAGKYLTDKLFVGYAYSFDAKPEEGENINEVKADYQIAPRWNFELRYGDAHSGDASLIWSRDY